MNHKTLLLGSCIALGVGASQAQTLSDDPATQRYLEAMMEKIRDSMVYPPTFPIRKAQCEVDFALTPEGRIVNPRISMSADNPDFDRECIGVFERIGSFPPLPASVPSRKDGLKLSIPLVFTPPPATERPWVDLYAEKLQTLTMDALEYPAGTPKKQGSCEVKLSLARDGTVLAVELSRSAQNPDLDEECTQVFRRVGRFPPFPESVPPQVQQLVFNMPINFELE